jgi:5,10-methylenetetrahydromethanopterin reductase
VQLAISQAGIPAGAPHEHWLRYVRVADEMGMSFIGVGDLQTRCFEMTVLLTMLALNTSSARLMPTISNPVSRHPAVMASSFASLQCLSGGRTALGISTGFSAVQNIGLPPATLAQLAEFIDTFRCLLSEGRATYRGNPCRLPWAPSVVPEGVPVYMAANGPAALRLAGALADGVITGMGLSEDVVASTLRHLEEGARSAGRALEDIEIWFQADVSIDDGSAKGIDDVMNNVVAAACARGHRSILDNPTVAPEVKNAFSQLRAAYDVSHHISTTEPNVQLASRLGLRDFLADRFAVVGSPDSVLRRLLEINTYGIRNVYISGVVADPLRLVTVLGEHVLPRVVAVG